jgi:hypothetical protein
MEQVGMIYNASPNERKESLEHLHSTENDTNNAPFLGKCEVCGDTHLILTVGQCGKG